MRVTLWRKKLFVRCNFVVQLHTSVICLHIIFASYFDIYQMNKLQTEICKDTNIWRILRKSPRGWKQNKVSHVSLSLRTPKYYTYNINYLWWPKSDWFSVSAEALAVIQQLEWTIPILAHETSKSINTIKHNKFVW